MGKVILSPYWFLIYTGIKKKGELLKVRAQILVTFVSLASARHLVFNYPVNSGGFVEIYES